MDGVLGRRKKSNHGTNFYWFKRTRGRIAEGTGKAAAEGEQGYSRRDSRGERGGANVDAGPRAHQPGVGDNNKTRQQQFSRGFPHPAPPHARATAHFPFGKTTQDKTRQRIVWRPAFGGLQREGVLLPPTHSRAVGFL